jgi:hypothetical protein
MEADSTKIAEILFSRWLKIQDLHTHTHTQPSLQSYQKITVTAVDHCHHRHCSTVSTITTVASATTVTAPLSALSTPLSQIETGRNREKNNREREREKFLFQERKGRKSGLFHTNT